MIRTMRNDADHGSSVRDAVQRCWALRSRVSWRFAPFFFLGKAL